MREMNKEILAEQKANLSAAKKALLEKMLRGKRASAGTPGIGRRPDQSTYPLSFAQQRLWFTEQIAGASQLYVIPTAVWIKGRLNATALEQALNIVIARHEVLRSSFSVQDGEPVQQVSDPVSISLHLCDVSDARDPDAGAWNVVRGQARRSM